MHRDAIDGLHRTIPTDVNRRAVQLRWLGDCLILVADYPEAERVLQDYLASKTLADLSREFERKAPHEFVEQAEAWFQLRRGDRTARRGPASRGRR